MAMFWNIDVLRRKDKTGNDVRITRPARIFADETLYPMPTVMNGSQGNQNSLAVCPWLLWLVTAYPWSRRGPTRSAATAGRQS
jgi:hypothetical protein